MKKMKNYIYGKNTCRNAIYNNDTLANVYLCDGFKDQQIFDALKKNKVKYTYISPKKMDDLVGRVNHQGIVVEVNEYGYLELDELIECLSEKQYPTIAILDGIEDPHNFGAILRSGDALGVDGYIIAANRQVGLTNTVAKVSTGAIEYAKVAKVTNLKQAIDKLKDNGYWIVASDGSATMDYRDVDYNMKTGIIIGSEGKGIGPLLLKNSDYVTKIPMVGHVNSLNASVAASLYFAAIYNSRDKR